MFTPVSPPRAECIYTVKQENPPYNGWGTDEDSLANCRLLVPPANKNSRERCEPDILRFMARIIVGLGEQEGCHGHEDRETRRFIVSYFLRDNTFMIYEPPVLNSGTVATTYVDFLLWGYAFISLPYRIQRWQVYGTS